MVEWTGLGGGLLDDLFDAGGDGLPDCGDRYVLREVIGKGGQGIVYAADDKTLGRSVAIKRLHDPGADQRSLQNEARTLGRMAYPAVPQVYDQGRSPDGGWFVVMQQVIGQELSAALPALGPTVERLRLFRSIAGAVKHAHAHGILHRDLKPENILVSEEGEPYIIDWGLAANGGPRAVCGSPHFAAPEQLDGQVADRRADVYALGVLLYVLLAEALPYGRSVKNFHEFRRLRAGLQRVPLRKRRPELPRALERIVDIAMAAQPAARYRTVGALIDDLDAFLAGRPLARDLPRLPWRGLGLGLAWAATLALAVWTTAALSGTALEEAVSPMVDWSLPAASAADEAAPSATTTGGTAEAASPASTGAPPFDQAPVATTPADPVVDEAVAEQEGQPGEVAESAAVDADVAAGQQVAGVDAGVGEEVADGSAVTPPAEFAAEQRSPIATGPAVDHLRLPAFEELGADGAAAPTPASSGGDGLALPSLDELVGGEPGGESPAESRRMAGEVSDPPPTP